MADYESPSRLRASPVTHPLRTILAAISLLLCGLSAGLCVVSYIWPVGVLNDRHFRGSDGDVWGYSDTWLAVNDGRVYLHRMVFTKASSQTRFSGQPGWSIGWGMGSFRFIRTWQPYKHESRPLTLGGSSGRVLFGTFVDSQWTIPLPLLVLLFAILPVHWAILRRRERRRNAAKVCVRCGYDLRACEERCSECGEPIPDRHQPVKSSLA